MVDYKEILRLTSIGYSLRQTAASLGHSHHTVKNVLELAAKDGVEWPIDDDVTNVELEKLFYPERKRQEVIMPSQTTPTSTVSCQRKASPSLCSGTSIVSVPTRAVKSLT